MTTWETIAAERADLEPPDLARVGALISSWGLVADVSLADLVLWLPTWNEAGFVAAALVRPTTAPTAVPDDIVGTFISRRRGWELDSAFRMGLPVDAAGNLPKVVALPGSRGRPIAVIERRETTRADVLLDQVYRELARILLGMIHRGEFPPDPLPPLGVTDAPRVGDGLLRLDERGVVVLASPNAASGFRRLGLATDLLGLDLARTAARLVHRPGPVPEALTLVAGGRIAGEAEVGNESATLVLRSWPLTDGRGSSGAIVLARDVTDSRARERDLLSKDSAIREVHHRVKNNLQTVSALLRLQSRRVVAPEARQALAEAGRRVAAIAAVHDILAVQPGEEVSLDDVLDRLVALSLDLAPGLRADLPSPVIELDSAVGLVATDIAGPLAMAVSELLANALEHSGATRIDVVAYRGNTAGQTPRLGIEVIDNGCGFSDQESTGLGLHIVRMLITEDLSGEVRVGAAVPTGTQAVIDVPVSIGKTHR